MKLRHERTNRGWGSRTRSRVRAGQSYELVRLSGFREYRHLQYCFPIILAFIRKLFSSIGSWLISLGSAVIDFAHNNLILISDRSLIQIFSIRISYLPFASMV